VNLFDYLAEEVLDMQTEEHKNFLINTSILQFLDSDTCDFLMDTQDSAKMLGELYKSGLFIEQLKPDVLRYHHIFRGFLQSQLHKYPEKTKNLHRKVASYYRAHHYWERAIAHLISAGDFTRVRQILDDVGDRLLQSGLKHSVRYWMTQLPEEEMAAYPYGNYLLGEVERTEARFDQALESYRTAQRLYQSQNNAWGMSLAMRGQAQVYLDTLRPINANQLLENALSLLEPAEYPQEVSELLTQIAENQVNQGAMAEAERSLQKARELSPIKSETQSFIEARLLLRTGRLDEGIRLLEELDPGKVEDVLHRPQRFHRETSLLLSLFYSLKGEQEIARDYAKEGLQVSRQLQASYVEAVAKIRLGHALQLDLQQGQDSHGMQQIQDLYEYAIQHVDILRIHVEPLWGLCRLVGYAGRLEEAKTIADKALVIAGNAGDEWIGLLVRISLGAALALAGDYEAASDVLSLANSLADKVNDNLAKTASLIWQSYAAQKQGFKNSAILFLEQALGLVQQHDYQFLLTRASLLGSDDPYTFYPLLQWARQMQVKPDLVMQILISASVGADYHPGYRLGLKLLGGFEARKGKHVVSSDQWKREKARQMLQALALNRTKGISKEQLAMYFWPAAEESTTNNNFKVTLSSLNQVLEPERPPKESPYFIIRNGDQYQLNPQAHIYLDIDEFERLARSHDLMDWEKALDLYKGRLLDGEPLQEYFMSDTQYYHRLYLDILVKLIDASLLQKDSEKALELSNRLVRQEPLLEVGYLFQMRIYAAMGNTALVHKVYQQALDVNQAVYGPGTEPDELKNLYFNLTR
jgi:DNA-binding SARP family transcriptional activator